MTFPFQDIVKREVDAAIRAQLGDIITNLAKGDLTGFLPGRQTPSEVKQDAKDRSIRTAIQQLGVDLVIALATVVGPMLLNLDVSSKEQWTLIGLSFLKTVISTIVSYVFRLVYAPRPENEISLAESKRPLAA